MGQPRLNYRAIFFGLHRLQPNIDLFDQLLDLPEGMVMEFGVYKGESIEGIRQLTGRKVYGFDSFQGLPEEWTPQFPKGEFACEVPKLSQGIELVVGRFEETLDDFLKGHPGMVALAHIDCDLYSSTRFVLDRLKDRFVRDSLLIFDEITSFTPAMEHECKAFCDYLNENDQVWHCVGRHNQYGAMFRKQ